MTFAIFLWLLACALIIASYGLAARARRRRRNPWRGRLVRFRPRSML